MLSVENLQQLILLFCICSYLFLRVLLALRLRRGDLEMKS
jgi:hypothetical protein